MSTPDSAKDIDALNALLRCPASHLPLQRAGDTMQSVDARFNYPIRNGVPDLRRAPERLEIDLPWYEPWDDLDTVTYGYPEVLVSTDELPSHLDQYLASVPGLQGNGRRVLEIGCGERQCEAWFTRHGFDYVGTDVDHRGVGPHVMADGHNLPFVDESFDFCTSMAVMEHLVSPLTAVNEIFRILKPGGTYFASSAFVYCFHDRASFHHMSHAGLLYVLRVAGFEVQRMWPDWDYSDSVPEMGFRGKTGLPWRLFLEAAIKGSEWSYVLLSNLARKLAGKSPIDVFERRLHTAGSVSFVARKPC